MNSRGYQFVLLILLIIVKINVFAQWDANTTMGENAMEINGMGHQDDVQAIQDRKLIVMILEEDQKLLTKWRRSGDTTAIVEYRDALNAFNKKFTDAVDSLWPFHKEYVTLGYDTITHIDKLVKPEYAVIYFTRHYVYIEGGEVKTKTSYDINWDEGQLIGADILDPKNRSSVDFYTVLKIAKVEEFRRTPPVQVVMPHIVPTNIDMAFGINYCVWYMNQKMRGSKDADLRSNLDQNAGQLSKLTLVISSEDVKHNFVDDPYAATYPFVFNVVPVEMYDWIITTNQPGYAYLIMNCGKACVMKAEDGEPLYISRLFDWSALISFKQMGKDIAKMHGKSKN